jgi:signal transduction histidine kinase
MGQQAQPVAARLPEGRNARTAPASRTGKRRPITASGAHAAPPGSARPRGAPRPIALTNWPVAWRLFAVIVLAVLMGLIFGGLQVATAVNKANQYAQVTKLALLGQKATVLAQALETERDQTAGYLAQGYSTPATAGDLTKWQAKLGGTWATTDAAASSFLAQAQAVGGNYPASTLTKLTNAEQNAQNIAGGLRTAAEGVAATVNQTGQFQPPSPWSAITDYSLAINTLFALDDSIAQGSGDSNLIDRVQSLGTLSRAKDQASQQRALLYAAFEEGGFEPNALPALASSIAQQNAYLVAFQTSATPDQLQSLANFGFGPNGRPLTLAQLLENYIIQANFSNQTFTNSHQDLLGTVNVNGISVAQTPGSNAMPINQDTAGQWYTSMTKSIDGLRTVESGLADSIVAQSQSLQNSAQRTAWITGLVTGGTLLLVLLAALLVARSVVLPLRRLRAGALDIASVSLPERVRALGESAEPADSLEVAPIAVMSSDEVGQVARAFDLVHQEAVRLAGNEAVLRASLNAMFVSLSRRSQSLIERLSRMIDSLELNEDDPERLSNLFAMDHLVTRMRRNSENLLVLAGHEGARKRTEPVLLGDVVRAAASEIEQYGRVVLSVQSGIEVTGTAATDVVHLLAEIMENATMFSPRSTEVHVTGQEVVTGGILIEVTDSGVGITEARLEQLNWRLENPPVVDVSVSRHMGLFAVSHLAARHGVRVRLRPSSPRGLTAMVWLPESVAAAATTGYGERFRRIAGRGYPSLEPADATARVQLQSTQSGSWQSPAQSGAMHSAVQSGGARNGSAHAGPAHAGPAHAGPVHTGSMHTGAYSTAAQAGGAYSPAGLPGGTERNGNSTQVTSNWFRPRRPSGSPGAGAPARTSGGQARMPSQPPRQPEAGQQSGGWQSGGHQSGGHQSGGHQSGGHQSGGWQSGGQQAGGWQPFQRAPEPVGGGTTNAGLPVRVPQANRMPSDGRPAADSRMPASSRPAYEAEPEAPTVSGPRVLAAPDSQGRSADSARSRLRGFQHGSRRAEAQLPREGEGAGR